MNRYIPVAEYTIGCCYYDNHGKPFKTTKIKADSLSIAMEKAREKLKPDTTQSLCYIEVNPNPEHIEHIEYMETIR